MPPPPPAVLQEEAATILFQHTLSEPEEGWKALRRSRLERAGDRWVWGLISFLPLYRTASSCFMSRLLLLKTPYSKVALFKLEIAMTRHMGAIIPYSSFSEQRRVVTERC